MGYSFTSEAIRRGCRGGERKAPPAGMTRDNFAVSKSPGWGLTRRLRREGRACSPMGRSHFSFGGERKVCKSKPAARRLREKALYCPFWRRGSLCRAQHGWLAYAYHRARSELAFFRRQNGRAFFPPLPIAALLPRSWREAGLPHVCWAVFLWLGYFCYAKGQREVKITLAFAIQPAGSRTRPASREARRRAAVKTGQRACPRAAPRPMGAEWGAEGHSLPDPRAARPVAERR